ncbi:hypothetical protein AB0N05_14525 [Nocardia sp. NPDC051030]|uniref:hypothetical protein n=1 Tax=Nocardia sp. NPDC051030 TaxID=3155162 RepID=UPI0034430697
MTSDDGRAGLRSEIGAFYAGFGQPELLRRAFEDAALVVGLVGEDRIPMFRVRGIDWICAFTSVEEYARYMVARGEVAAENEYRYQVLLGSRLIDYAVSRSESTGVSVDCVGAQPFAFPPVVADRADELGVGA